MPAAGPPARSPPTAMAPRRSATDRDGPQARPRPTRTAPRRSAMPAAGPPAPLPGDGDEPVQFRLGAQALDQDLGGIAMIDCGTEVRRCLSAFKGSSVLKFVV